MPFLQLDMLCPSGTDGMAPAREGAQALAPEAVEAACFAAGALSVTLTDAADTPIFEPELNTTPLWPQVRISALFDANADRAAILHMLESELGAPAPPGTFTEIADRAWEREWLADFHPMRFGRRLWICPHEQRVDARDATIVRLDPGLAFGTGTHPTTALCLEWLDGAALEGREVIDYGCGSGILAIAALKLGARRAFCIDHDPQALLATRENAQRNEVEGRVATMTPEDAAALNPAPVVLANILASPLIELAPRLQRLTAPGGHLVLSGILTEQADAVAAAYRPWIEMEPAVRREDWVRLHGGRSCKT